MSRYEHMLVDSAAMHLIRRPRDFDVIVTENMFGDILTDEASMLAGSMGLLPSASLGAGGRGGCSSRSTAPRPTSPVAASPIPMRAILSAAMLLRYSLELETEALRGSGGIRRRNRGRADGGPRAARRRPPRQPTRARRRCGAGCDLAARSSPAEVRDQVAGILDSRPTPATVPRRCRPLPRRLVHSGVRHARRVRDQALDAAQRFGKRKAGEAFEKRADRGLAAGELEAQHRAEADCWRRASAWPG